MKTVSSYPDETAIAKPLTLADLSFLHRWGVKGARAAAWLANQGIPIPDRPNTWSALPTGGIIARLGISEFLLEDALTSSTTQSLADLPYPAQVYPVLRQDLAIALWGRAVPDLLAQTCNIHVASLKLSDRPILLASMIGVAVTLLPAERDSLPYYRIWCDSTFGNYVWRTLLEIAKELGGGAIGAIQVLD
jgi:sarcosine oxidase subunit gamma